MRRRTSSSRVCARRRGKRQIREGLAYVRGRRDMLLVLMVVFFVGTFGMNFQITSALMATQEFRKGAGEYGLLGTFMAVGSLAGALLAARRRNRPLRLVHRGRGPGLRCPRGGRRADADLLAVRAVLPVIGLAALLTLTAANASVQMGIDPGCAAG